LQKWYVNVATQVRLALTVEPLQARPRLTLRFRQHPTPSADRVRKMTLVCSTMHRREDGIGIVSACNNWQNTD
jgi:hypothetical protein